MKRIPYRVVPALVAAALPGFAGAQSAPGDEIEPAAVATLQRMCDYLGAQKQFSFRARSTLDVVTAAGEKIEFGGVSDVIVQRPNHLVSRRVGDLTDTEFFYDGSTVTVYGRNVNHYASQSAPPTLDAMLEQVRTRIGAEPPAADLIYTDACQSWRGGMKKATSAGIASIDGVKTYHLAFRGAEVDWQIWIEEGPRPLPHKYVITSRDAPGMPQSGVELSQWNTAPRIDAGTFKFTPPAGATKIDFFPAGAAPAQSR